MLRTVLDSNVVLAADRASNPLSPNKEIINRWSLGEFIWLVTADIVAEYAEKLLDKGNAASEVETFIAELLLLAKCVEIRFISDITQSTPTTRSSFSAPSMARRVIWSVMTVTSWRLAFSMRNSSHVNQQSF